MVLSRYRPSRIMNHVQISRSRLLITVVTWLVLGTHPASACNVYGNGWGSKWDNPVWPNNAVVTWSFMTPGVGIDPSAPVNWTGTNSLGSGNPSLDIRVKIDALHGAGAFDAAVQRAFDTWTAATNVTFSQVPDQGGDFASVTYPDIRIGAFSFAPGDLAGAAGFGPPGHDDVFPDALAGDLAFNDQNNFNIDPGNEDDLLQTGAGGLYLNDIEGLVLHEIGHTLGIGHTDVIDAVLCGYVPPGTFNGSACIRDRVNRVLEPDDLTAVRYIYGPQQAAAGDISFDCMVDAADILLASRAVSGILVLNGAQTAQADVAPLSGGSPSPDSLVNAADLVVLIRKALGLISF